MLTDAADAVREKPKSKVNGHTPPPAGMERWAVIRDDGETINIFQREVIARTYAGTHRDAQRLSVKKIEP